MGPLLFCALMSFGSVVAIGIVAAGAPRPIAAVGMTPARRLATILFVFATGAGSSGAVVALLAAVSRSAGAGARSADAAAAPLVAVIPIVGAVIAIGMMMAAFARLDAWVLGRSVLFVLPQIALTIVAAMLTAILPGGSAGAPAPAPFVVLGSVAAGAIVGLGIAGQAAIAPLAALEGFAPDDPVVRVAIGRGLRRCLPFELAAFGSAVIAIVLVVGAGGAG